MTETLWSHSGRGDLEDRSRRCSDAVIYKTKLEGGKSCLDAPAHRSRADRSIRKCFLIRAPTRASTNQLIRPFRKTEGPCPDTPARGDLGRGRRRCDGDLHGRRRDPGRVKERPGPARQDQLPRQLTFAVVLRPHRPSTRSAHQRRLGHRTISTMGRFQSRCAAEKAVDRPSRCASASHLRPGKVGFKDCPAFPSTKPSPLTTNLWWVLEQGARYGTQLDESCAKQSSST
jgi:hypothetical protein